MTRNGIFLLLILVLTLAFPAVACQPTPPAADSGAYGSLAGSVTDNPFTRPPGMVAKTYPGISIEVLQAVASGTFKTSADAPVQTSYRTGEKIALAVSGPDGRFSFSLPPGNYAVRGFGGEKVYASTVFTEVKAGATTEIVLHLNFGV
jgi:hypothetical protein